VSWSEVRLVVWLGFLTMLRVAVVLVVITVVWVPLGIWIGQSSRLTHIVQPIAQFFAAFPANLLFPIVAWGLVYFHLNINLWSVLLMALGTQWYVLFNVLAGVGSLPRHLNQAVTTVNVTGWLRWKRLMLPGIFPFYITGLMTAAGGAWNISIIAEVISWGHQHFQARGLGAYVAQVSNQGDFTHLSLGIVVMSLYVVVVNRLFWLPLYRMAQERFRIQ
jgi:NitT/TauT family transport system permease protein